MGDRDRALYDADLTSAINFSISTPGGAPLSLTYGPSFFTLANSLRRPTVVGLNRRLAQLNNTIEAAKESVGQIDLLEALELGNEPVSELGIGHSRLLAVTQSLPC